jgi:LytS/YehU family sensor histidine kinase
MTPEQTIWQSVYVASITSLIAAREGYRADHAAHAASIAHEAAEAFKQRFNDKT